MCAVVAMDKNGAFHRLRSLDQLQLGGGGNSVVAVRQMNVAHPIRMGAVHIRKRAVDGDDRSNP